jgi:hypothetical protein
VGRENIIIIYIFPFISRSIHVLRRFAEFSPRYVTASSRLLSVLSRYATFHHGPHGKLGCMVAVSSRSIAARPGMLQFMVPVRCVLLRSDTAHSV